jgi:hypothetical protein
MLGDEERAQDAGTNHEVGTNDDAGMIASTGDASSRMAGSADTGPRPDVVVRIKPLDCGACFELQAEGQGGQPPYLFQWEDGSFRAQRSVCTGAAAVALSVVAFDAANAQSSPHVLHLESVGDAGCPALMEPADAAVAALLCLENASFEGTPAVNLGEASAFDAAPWSACTHPVMTNAPDIANQTVAVSDVPSPTDGLTYLALSEGEQVSQELCAELVGGAPVYLRLDLARVDFAGDTEQVFLEIHAGLGVDCSQRELLWASGALQTGWQHFCVTLQPSSFMTQLTLRAKSDMTSLNTAYLLVDDLQPVDSCP